AKTVTVNQATTSAYKYNALYGRLNYIGNEKYILNLTARRDGSSRFGDANKFHNFWGVGIGWIFTKESWIKNSFAFISFGKIRGSYGTTGNDGIGEYSYLGLYANSNGPIPYQNAAGLALFSLSNPYLQWEETRKWQGGMDLGFINDRIVINVTYARNRSSNQLASYQLPSITGRNGITQNLPATIQNTSWEFTLNTTNIKNSRVKWTTSVNLTIPRNKLVNFPNIELTPYTNPINGVIVGQPLGTLVVYPYGGVDIATGKYLLIDSIGNSTIGPGAVKNVFLSTFSNFYGGLQNTLSYKGFQLDFLFQFVRQKGSRQMYYYNESLNPGQFSNGVGNQPVTVLDRWQKPGDIATVTLYTTKSISVFPIFSDVLYSYDASYIRLKNISLSWQLPSNWLSPISLQNARVYFQGQNLATISKFSGLDPESQSVNSLPPLQMWTVGTQIDF
ncbi:MAG TPA: SusC/RagA family TonB-linked outer membrane protein, partial [Niastella sp.]